MGKVFKPGEQVRFPGLSMGKLNIPEISGELVLNDSNTTVKGVMTIKGDLHRMMFCPDGTIYCHAQFGDLLEHVEIKAQAE